VLLERLDGVLAGGVGGGEVFADLTGGPQDGVALVDLPAGGVPPVPAQAGDVAEVGLVELDEEFGVAAVGERAGPQAVGGRGGGAVGSPAATSSLRATRSPAPPARAALTDLLRHWEALTPAAAMPGSGLFSFQ